MMRPGLSAKLSILLACIGILASGLTGYYAYSSNRMMLVAESERDLLTSTQLLSRRLTTAISDVAADALMLAAMPAAAPVAEMGPGSAEARSRLTRVFSNFVRLHPEYLQARLISRRQYGLEQIRFDRDGDRIVLVDGARLQEKGHLPYVFETLALAPGRVYVSPIAVNHEQGAHSAEGRPTLRLATPVAALNGNVVGVVVLNVDLQRLLETLQTDLPQHYQLYMANERGDFLVHPDPAKTFGFDKGRRVVMQDSFGATTALFEQGQHHMVLNGLQAPDDAPGQIVAFVRQPFGLPENHQFVVLGLARSLPDVLSGARELGHSIVQMVLVFSVLSIVLAVLFARALTRPLQMLAHAATSFSTAQAMEALPLERSDEIGIVARCFDRMRCEIKAHMDVLRDRQQELDYLARHDPLTGLPNRSQFFQQLESAIALAGPDEQLAVLFVDLDRFKEVNDELGHTIGDHALATAAQRMRRTVRASDVVARLGGDEFIVLIRGDVVEETVHEIARNLLQALNEPLPLDERQIDIGASIGVSQFPDDGRTALELVTHADIAMYGAKTRGRRGYLCYRNVVEQDGAAASMA
jgi:diguanylate cyclase (GGDEF)-like protein